MEISSNTAMPCRCQEQGVASSFSASETRVASISESQSLDMSLVTAEGDKVTLSYDAYTAALYAEHGQVEATKSGVASQYTEISAGQYERELTLSIEGDLNAEERRDIRKAIKTLGRMLDKFVEGKARPMMAKARKLGGLETIAQLDVSMAYERQVLTARQTDMAVAYGQNGQGLYQPALPAKEAVQAPVQAEIKKLAKEAVQAETEKPAKEVVQAPVKAETEKLAKEVVQVSLQSEAENLAKKMAKVVKAVEAPWKDVLRMTKRLFDYHRKMADSKESLVAELINNVQDRFKELVSGEKDD